MRGGEHVAADHVENAQLAAQADEEFLVEGARVHIAPFDGALDQVRRRAVRFDVGEVGGGGGQAGVGVGAVAELRWFGAVCR